MATVRITKELTDTLLRVGSAPFHNQYATVKDKAAFDHHAEAVWDALWGEHATTVGELPVEAFRYSQRIDINIRASQGEVNIRLLLPEPRPFPYRTPNNDLVGPMWGETVQIKEHLHWADLFSDVSAWQGQLEQITAQRKSFEKNLERLLGAYSSLAPALMAWPPLWDLLPDDVKARHKDVTKREKKEVVLDGIDLSSMTATLTVRKLMGGS